MLLSDVFSSRRDDRPATSHEGPRAYSWLGPGMLMMLALERYWLRSSVGCTTTISLQQLAPHMTLHRSQEGNSSTPKHRGADDTTPRLLSPDWGLNAQTTCHTLVAARPVGVAMSTASHFLFLCFFIFSFSHHLLPLGNTNIHHGY